MHTIACKTTQNFNIRMLRRHVIMSLRVHEMAHGFPCGFAWIDAKQACTHAWAGAGSRGGEFFWAGNHVFWKRFLGPYRAAWLRLQPLGGTWNHDSQQSWFAQPSSPPWLKVRHRKHPLSATIRKFMSQEQGRGKCFAWQKKKSFVFAPKYSLPDWRERLRNASRRLWSLLRNWQGTMSHAMLANPKSNLHGYNITYKQNGIWRLII